MSFLEEFESGHEDPFLFDGSLILLEPSEDPSFSNDSLMKEFETELLVSQPEQRTQQDHPPQTTQYTFPLSSPHPFPPPSPSIPPQQPPHQETLCNPPQHPLYSHLSHSASDAAHPQSHPQQEHQQHQQASHGGFPQYSSFQQQFPHQQSHHHQHHQQQQQHQQQQTLPQPTINHPAEFSPVQFSSEGVNFKKRKTMKRPHCATSAPTPSPFIPLRPIAPQVTNTQYLAQLSAPPSPPPPPPKGHLISSASKTPPSSHLFFPQSLSSSLSDSETRCLSEDFSGGELRMIAPKPPSLPPADFHQRATQKPPHDSIFSSPTTKRTRTTRTKRRSVSKMERGQKERLLEKERFLEGCELNNQLAMLRAKFAASEAESRALKERLSATESELAELRLKVQQYDNMNNSSDLHTPVALSPNDDLMTTPSPTFC